jgi:uncharacterized RDD family membrane protein YckC
VGKFFKPFANLYNMKKKKITERPIVRLIITIGSILMVIVGIKILTENNNRNTFTGWLALIIGTLYLLTEIEQLLTPQKKEISNNEDHNLSQKHNELALWWQRLSAFLIDFLICFCLSICIQLIVKLDNSYTNFLFLFVLFLYYLLTESFSSTSIGKRIFRLQVRDLKTWGKPKKTQILGRTILRFIPFDILTFISKRPNGWHDYLSGTVVVLK